MEQWLQEAFARALQGGDGVQVESRGRGNTKDLLARLAQRGAANTRLSLLSREDASGNSVRAFMYGRSAWGGSDEHQRNETYAAMLARHQAESDYYAAGSDLVGWWRLEEASGDALDSSGNGWDGAVTGCTRAQPGIESYSYAWDGVDDNIVVGDISADLDITTASPPSFSLEAWMNPLAGGTNLGGIALATSYHGRLLYDTANQRGRFQLKSGSTVVSTANNSMAVGSWHYLAVTYTSGGDMALYLNSDSPVSATPADRDISAATMRVWIGNAQTVLKGRMDEIALWGRVLTPEEVRAHYYLGRLRLGLKP